MWFKIKFSAKHPTLSFFYATNVLTNGDTPKKWWLAQDLEEFLNMDSCADIGKTLKEVISIDIPCPVYWCNISVTDSLKMNREISETLVFFKNVLKSGKFNVVLPLDFLENCNSDMNTPESAIYFCRSDDGLLFEKQLERLQSYVEKVHQNVALKQNVTYFNKKATISDIFV